MRVPRLASLQRIPLLPRITDTLTRRKPTHEEVKETLPTFWPIFTILVVVVEAGLLAATIITGGGLAPIAFRPKSEHRVITDFNNQSQVAVTREIVPNFFIGPFSAALVHTGAKYTPVSSLYMASRKLSPVVLSLKKKKKRT